MSIEQEILLEENERKPNQCTAKAMLGVMLAAICIEVLNEVGVFKVNSTSMRVSMMTVALCSILIQFCGRIPKIASKHTTKYVVLLLVMLEVLLVATVLGQWGELIIFLPLTLAVQYHSKKVTAYCFIGTTIIAILAAPLNCLLGLAQVDYYIYLVRSCGYTLGNIAPDPDFDRIRYALEIFRYISVSRGITTAGIGTVAFYITKLDSANIEKRVIATVDSRTDALTGIYNRLSYEAKIKEYEQDRPEHLICIYADADSLHNINKNCGHDIGDNFLKLCASQIAHNFGKLTYRIGGDEFLTFVENDDMEKVRDGVSQIQQVLGVSGYHMSFGICKLEEDMSIYKLIAAAERKMYAAKSEYYVTSGKDRRNN